MLVRLKVLAEQVKTQWLKSQLERTVPVFSPKEVQVQVLGREGSLRVEVVTSATVVGALKIFLGWLACFLHGSLQLWPVSLL